MSTSRDVQFFRSQGPRGLDAWLAAHGAAASAELDAVCRQKDAHTSLLYWFTELPAAVAEARRTGKPILSLRLLGNLDEELSCANSRFFRKLLYCEPRLNALLREGFVLHWQSVRPVPVVTIDFGGGKKLVRTLTGNSVHLVLDPAGRPVDALPGLMRAEVFAQKLMAARVLAGADRRQLAALHRRQLAAGQPAPLPPGFPSAPPPGYPVMQPPGLPPGYPPPFIPGAPPTPAEPSRAFRASAMAMSKHIVEAPILNAVSPTALDADTAQNLALHDRVHEAFADGAEWAGLGGFVEWIYAELFAMPLGDPALGLDVADPFSAIDVPAAQPLSSAPRRAHGTPVPRPATAGTPVGASVVQPTLPRRQPAPQVSPAPQPALQPPQSGMRRLASTIARAITP